VNAGSMDALAFDWKADIIRISMYVQEGGYETDPAGFKVKIDAIVDMAVARGMYALLDWHMLSPGDPNFNTERAREFFTYMAQKHGNKPHILYEIANEPNGVSWASIRSYAHQIIPVIRQFDPDGVILVGTRAWSSLGVSDGSGPEEIVASPVNGTNLMYVFHMYAASHGQEYRDALSWAADRLPMFVTEWGTQQASGDGPNNFTSAQQYVDLMTQKKISWINWNYSDDFRTGAVWMEGTCPNGPWNTTRLKEAGLWIRNRIVNR
jgi:endoglucanase